MSDFERALEEFKEAAERAKSSKTTVVMKAFWCALALTFVWAKLTGMISWSWWLVLAPVLWPLYLIGVIVGVGVLFFAAAGITDVGAMGVRWIRKKIGR